MNTAIIVAAGSGQRFGGDTPKQFVEILGKPLIVHTLERFEECPDVDGIVLVLGEEDIQPFTATVVSFGLRKLRSIVPGGRTRAESVRNGFNSQAFDDGDIVAVHDGARPLVTVDDIARTIGVAKETGASCLVAEVTDTIKTVRDDRIAATVDRTHLRRALTPQAFRADILRRAFSASDLSDAVTDECYLVEKLGIEIATVVGHPGNIKVTRPIDLVVAEALLRGGGT